MYINLTLLEHSNLTLPDLMVMQLCKQNRTEDVSSYIELYTGTTTVIARLTSAGILTTVKRKNKSESDAQLLRLTKNGTSILEEVQVPGVNSDDLVLFEWLKKIYKEKGKSLGNQKRTKSFIAQFRAQSGIERKSLAHLIAVFVNDEDNLEYNHVLEYAFFKGENAFQTRFDLDQSRLWKYYHTKLEYFTRKFKEFGEA